MALTFFWRCESTDLNATHDYSGGDTSGTSINSATIRVGQGKISSSNALAKPASVTGGVTFTPTGIFPGSVGAGANTTVGCFGTWIKQKTPLFEAAYSTSGFIRFRNATSTQFIYISGVDGTNPSDYGARFSGANGTVNLGCSGGVITVDNWFFTVLRWDSPGNKARLEIYDEDLVLVDSVEDLAITDFIGKLPADIDLFSVGSWSSSTTNEVLFDNAMVGDTYDEPLQRYANYISYTQVAYPVMARMFSNGAFQAHEFVQMSSGIPMKINSNNSVQVLDMVEVAASQGKLYANGMFACSEFIENES